MRVKYRGVPAGLASWEGVHKDPGPTGLSQELSLRPSGREVYLSLEHENNPPALDLLGTLWSLVVPLGFMPWSRFPVPGPQDSLFHFPGPWEGLLDSLHSEGLGERAWPSFATAAQCEVGTWEGPFPTERAIQTHLHRLGIHCGAIDGKMDERVLSSFKALGFGGLPAVKMLEALERMQPLPVKEEEHAQLGHFVLKGRKVEAFSSGKVNAAKTRTGYAVEATGPGRLILLIGGVQ